MCVLTSGGSFWNYNSSADPSSDSFVNAIWEANDKIAAAGGLVCPSKCSCDLLSACGKPYLKPTSVGLAECVHPGIDTQRWVLSAQGQIQLASNTSQCLQSTAANTYPLSIGDCTQADAWAHNATSSEMIHVASKACMDVRESDGAVGAWTCGPAENQPNQHWAFDTTTGNLVSLSTSHAGSCVTAM